MARKRAHLGARHAEIADAMAILTSALVKLGHYGESEQIMRDALDIDAGAYTHPNAHTAWHLNDFANVLAYEGKFTEAGVFYDKSIAIDEALAPAAGLTEATSIGNLARLRFSQGAYADAETSLRDAISRKQRLLGADYADNGRSYDRAALAEILIARGRLDEARVIADGALAEAQRRHRDAHPETAFALSVEAEILAANGATERAATSAGAAVAMYATLADQSSEKAIRARLLYGDLLQALGRNGEAEPQVDGALAAANAITPGATALVAHADADLARIDASLGKHAAAEQLRAEAKALLPDIEVGPNTDRDATLRLLASAASKTTARR